jgi:hypothetical protein
MISRETGMKNILVFFCFLFLALQVAAQTEPAPPPVQPPPPVYGWTHSFVTAVMLNQVAFSNWAQGGVNALSWSAAADGKSVDEMEVMHWFNGYRFGFGQTRMGEQGTKKADDRMELESVLLYKTGASFEPYAAVTFQSQFAPGYIYDANNVATQVSAFFDPAYFVESVGAGYQPSKQFKTRLGLALREVLTSKYTAFADDPKTTEVEQSSVSGGLESVTNIELQLDDNVLFVSQLELFSAFKQMDEVIVRNTSSVAAKVGKFVTVVLNVQLINEKRITPKTQVKQTLGIGASFTIF